MTEVKQQKTSQRKRRSHRVASSTATEVKPEEKPEPATEVKPEEKPEKIVYVGQKPVKNYVVACLTSFGAGSTRIIVKARGRAICKAVDTVELLRRRFMKDADLRGITISTEQMIREGDRKTNVSAIEITVVRT